MVTNNELIKDKRYIKQRVGQMCYLETLEHEVKKIN